MGGFQENIIEWRPLECAVNPLACRESILLPILRPETGTAAGGVVGAGPAGLTAARGNWRRADFKVTVLERVLPGGQLILARPSAQRGKSAGAVKYLTRQAIRQGRIPRPQDGRFYLKRQQIGTPATKTVTHPPNPGRRSNAASDNARILGICGRCLLHLRHCTA